MTIVIREVLEPTGRGCRAVVEHAGGHIAAEVALSPAQAYALMGQSVSVELAHDHVRAWHFSPPGAGGLGIFALPGGAIRLVGDVHNAGALEDPQRVYDLCIGMGPIFFAVDSEEVGGADLPVGCRVAVDVEGLCLYPTGV
jgi:hypothetical protein